MDSLMIYHISGARHIQCVHCMVCTSVAERGPLHSMEKEGMVIVEVEFKPPTPCKGLAALIQNACDDVCQAVNTGKGHVCYAFKVSTFLTHTYI